MKPHWYFITFEECPVCGRWGEYRERRYTPRPSEWWDRHEWLPSYCGCMY